MAGRAQREMIQGHPPFDRHQGKGEEGGTEGGRMLRCPNQPPPPLQTVTPAPKGLSLTPQRTLLKASPV